MGGKGSAAHQIAAQIAASQHGVATRAELLAAGVTARQIDRRLQSGALLRAYSGVYRVGHRAPNTEATYLAAVKACGQGAALSRRAAGHLWRLLKGAPPPPEVVTAGQRRIQGISTSRRRSVDWREFTEWRGIPVTTVPRTLVDLAAVLSEEDLARVCHEASVLYRTTPVEVEAVLERRPNSRGAATLRRVLRGEVHVTLSKLERGFLRVLKAAALPLPRTNLRATGRWVDCRWPDHHLTVELDSYRFHSSRHAWTQDRRREREAYARRDDFRRYTWSDVFEDQGLMLEELRGLLPHRSAGGRRASTASD